MIDASKVDRFYAVSERLSESQARCVLESDYLAMVAERDGLLELVAEAKYLIAEYERRRIRLQNNWPIMKRVADWQKSLPQPPAQQREVTE